MLPLESAEWNDLPPNFKRKYFSSLERLRHAQESTSSRTNSTSSSSPRGIAKPLKPGTSSSHPSLARRNSSYFRNPSILRGKKPISPTSDTFSSSDAQWFLRLPPKVQRKHFTQEERQLLSGNSANDIPDAADVRLYREINRSVPTLRSSSPSSMSSYSTFEPEQPVGSAIDMDESMMDSFRWIDKDEELDLASTLDDYHTFINKESGVSPSKRLPSFRRAFSTTSLPFGSHWNYTSLPADSADTTTEKQPLPTATPTSAKQHHNSRPVARHLRPTHGNNDHVPASESSAQHYQDPEARLKLRVYLASPQKFDEAIEFGFPSMDDKENRTRDRPLLSRKNNTAPCKTFLHDDNPSLFDALDDDDDEDENDDATSLPERGSPYTPMNASFHDTYLLSPSDAASSGSSNPLQGSTATLFPRPTVRHNITEPYAQVLAGNREMTLRMTLTRPDLRANEKALYANTTGDDPLALEHLPPTTNKNADIWDQLPKDRGIVRKIWRKVSRKSGS